ncbi:MAG: hypothetical protein QNJ55_30830 [Xenococcus sp. MO_188.B8]|nr:hypothetical protein [Xenococcus sp. MO_188.B8]
MSSNLNSLKITFTIYAWLLLAIGLIFCQQTKALADEFENPKIELIQPTESSNNSVQIIDLSEIIENADIQPTDNNAILDKIDDELDRTVDRVIDTIFSNLPDSILSFLGGFQQTVDDFVSSKIPDIGKIIDIVFNSELEEGEADLPSRQQSETLEGTPNSYAISESETDAVVREILVETVESSSLNESAQTNLKQTAVLVQKTVDESVNLGDDSQNRDVTQQILQNLSQQEAISATRQGIIVQQNQQAQVDRAISNILNAQQAEELAAINAAKRREEIGTTNLTVRQWGLLRLPGNPTEQSEDDI